MTAQKQFYELHELLNQCIGFDFLHAAPVSRKITFPPHDIFRNGENYNIVIALAGYKASDISITHQDGILLVESAKLEPRQLPEGTEILHRGIAQRSFKLSFNLSPDIIVDGSILADGILTITLHRVIPESKQPKRIPIISG